MTGIPVARAARSSESVATGAARASDSASTLVSEAPSVTASRPPVSKCTSSIWDPCPHNGGTTPAKSAGTTRQRTSRRGAQVITVRPKLRWVGREEQPRPATDTEAVLGGPEQGVVQRPPGHLPRHALLPP